MGSGKSPELGRLQWHPEGGCLGILQQAVKGSIQPILLRSRPLTLWSRRRNPSPEMPNIVIRRESHWPSLLAVLGPGNKSSVAAPIQSVSGRYLADVPFCGTSAFNLKFAARRRRGKVLLNILHDLNNHHILNRSCFYYVVQCDGVTSRVVALRCSRPTKRRIGFRIRADWVRAKWCCGDR